ncbi:MAG TPA: hypothetical protein VFQ88_01790 [Nevskiaceae bacterium]|nr:hypothetical protein [Nevskiaceae bacterium]
MRCLWVGGLVLFASLASAHIIERSNVRVSLDARPPALKQITVQLRFTLAPEVLVENKSSHTLVIYDQHHVPFIRIGPQGVDANLTSPAWYESRQPEGNPSLPPQVHDGAKPKWAQVSKNHFFGWFDRRISIGEIKIPPAVVAARKLAEFSHWQIPVAFNGKQMRLSGQFVYIPPATGHFESRLLSSSWNPYKGVTVSLTPGRQPAIFLSNHTGKAIVVYGRDGGPFLRIGPDHVEANLRSPSWQQLHPAGEDRTDIDSAATPRWHRIAGGSQYAWIDFRAGYRRLLPPPAAETAHHSAVVRTWKIPLRIGEQASVIEGETLWVPFHHVHPHENQDRSPK